MILLSFIFSILGFLFSLYIFYSCLVRYLKIKNLQEEILNKIDKENYLKTLHKYCLITGGFAFICLLSLVFKTIEWKMIISVICIMSSSYIFQDLLDEIQDFDIKKKDAEILLDFLKKRDLQADEYAKNNKIKKIDSFENKKEH